MSQVSNPAADACLDDEWALFEQQIGGGSAANDGGDHNTSDGIGMLSNRNGLSKQTLMEADGKAADYEDNCESFVQYPSFASRPYTGGEPIPSQHHQGYQMSDNSDNSENDDDDDRNRRQQMEDYHKSLSAATEAHKEGDSHEGELRSDSECENSPAHSSGSRSPAEATREASPHVDRQDSESPEPVHQANPKNADTSHSSSHNKKSSRDHANKNSFSDKQSNKHEKKSADERKSNSNSDVKSKAASSKSKSRHSRSPSLLRRRDRTSPKRRSRSRSRSPRHDDRKREFNRREIYDNRYCGRRSPESRYRRDRDGDRRRNERNRRYDNESRRCSRSRSPRQRRITKEMMVEAILKDKGMDRLADLEASGDLVESNEKPSELPLDEASVSRLPRSKRRIAELSAKAQAFTGVALPKYYNPAAINPLKYAEQVQKRKLLWQGAKEKKAVSSSWQTLLAATSGDEKFKKLVGLKEDGASSSDANESAKAKQQQMELMRTLDAQYEIARLSTHTLKGVGLGFGLAVSSQAQPPPVSAAPPNAMPGPLIGPQKKPS